MSSLPEIVTTAATILGSGAGGGVLAVGAKPFLAWLRARAQSSATQATAQVELAKVEVTADLTLNERLWARVAQLESRLDLERSAMLAERRQCDERIDVLRAQIGELRETCARQEEEITDLRNDKIELARQAKALADEMAAMRREGRR